jgi:hypothetical protein
MGLPGEDRDANAKDPPLQRHNCGQDAGATKVQKKSSEIPRLRRPTFASRMQEKVGLLRSE